MQSENRSRDVKERDHIYVVDIELQEYETACLDDPEVGGFLIDFRDITSVVANYCKQRITEK